MTPLVVAAVWLVTAALTLALRVRVATGRFASGNPQAQGQAVRWMASPLTRWSDVFLCASSCVAAWFARGEGARRRVSPVGLGVAGLGFLLATQVIRGAAGGDPGAAATVALLVTTAMALALLAAAAYLTFVSSTDAARKDFLKGRE